jgi:hypothetical protein
MKKMFSYFIVLSPTFVIGPPHYCIFANGLSQTVQPWKGKKCALSYLTYDDALDRTFR